MGSAHWAAEGFAEGLRLYRAGKYFAAHEAWELLWIAALEPERTFLQGLIQVSAAYHHIAHGNERGARRLLEGALQRFETYPPCFGGVAVATLRDDIRDRLRILASGQPCANIRPVRVGKPSS